MGLASPLRLRDVYDNKTLCTAAVISTHRRRVRPKERRRAAVTDEKRVSPERGENVPQESVLRFIHYVR